MKRTIWKNSLIIIIIIIGLLTAGTTSGIKQDKNKQQYASVTTDTFYPTDDSFMGNNDDVNNGNWIYISIRNGGQGNHWVVSTALKFDISSLPSNAIVKSASVNLYYYRNIDNSASGRTLNMYRFESDWNEETITRPTMPSVSSTLSSTATVPSSTGAWVSWDVTSDVQKFLSGTLQNYGWIINDEHYWGGANIPYMLFRSKEYGTNIPTLEIETTYEGHPTITPNPMAVYMMHAIPPMNATIYLGDLIGHSVNDIDQSTVRINGVLTPQTTSILPSYPGYNGNVLQITNPIAPFIQHYMPLYDTTDHEFTVSGSYTDATTFTFSGSVTMVGHRSGDVNNDEAVDVTDAVFLINYIFAGGPGPHPTCYGDVNGDGSVDIADSIYLIQYIFSDGPAPVPSC